MASAVASPRVHVFVERSMRGWLDDMSAGRHNGETAVCLDLYDVTFVERLVSEPGDCVICHFLAPDAESVRQAMRGAGIESTAVWAALAEDVAALPAGRSVGKYLVADRRSGPGLQDARNNWKPRATRRFRSRDGSRTIDVLEWLRDTRPREDAQRIRTGSFFLR